MPMPKRIQASQLGCTSLERVFLTHDCLGDNCGSTWNVYTVTPKITRAGENRQNMTEMHILLLCNMSGESHAQTKIPA